MKHISKSLIAAFLILFFYGQSYAQTFKCSVYFNSAKDDLTAESQKSLDNLIDSLKDFQTYEISIKGNTDNVGDSIYNKSLSKRRVASVQSYLTSKGIAETVFNTSAFGEEKPITQNISAKDKQLNRRVDIIVSIVKRQKEIASIFDLYRKIEPEPQKFCIDPSKDTVLRCRLGTLVYIKVNSFKISKSCSDKCLTIKTKEAFLNSAMIMENLSTTSNGAILETGGMVYTEVNDCRGNKLNPVKDKDLVIFVPTDKVVPEMKIFQGNRTPHDSIMNWTASNSSVLANFSLDELNQCADILGCINPGCERCSFFFCRIRRAGVFFKGMTNKAIHRKNVALRKCQRALRKGKIRQSTGRGNLNRDLQTKCDDLKNLYDKYGVRDLEALANAINKPLLDSFGVSTMAELRDTMAKVNKRKVELSYLNKSISYEDFKYYVYNTNKLGWSNVDAFANFKKSQLTTMTVNFEPAANTDCKLVFRDRKIVLPGKKSEGVYKFEGIPEGDRVWIVALKYDEGLPYLSITDAVISKNSFEVSLKELSLDELKSELQKLDFGND